MQFAVPPLYDSLPRYTVFDLLLPSPQIRDTALSKLLQQLLSPQFIHLSNYSIQLVLLFASSQTKQFLPQKEKAPSSRHALTKATKLHNHRKQKGINGLGILYNLKFLQPQFMTSRSYSENKVE